MVTIIYSSTKSYDDEFFNSLILRTLYSWWRVLLALEEYLFSRSCTTPTSTKKTEDATTPKQRTGSSSKNLLTPKCVPAVYLGKLLFGYCQIEFCICLIKFYACQRDFYTYQIESCYHHIKVSPCWNELKKV